MKVVIPAYGRHELTRRAHAYYSKIGADARIIESPDEKGHVSGVAYALCENKPLGHKFNRAIQLATKCEGSALIVGSDCLVTQHFIDFMAERDRIYAEVQGCHFFNSTTGEMVFAPRFACGSGKFMGEPMLKYCGYAPYNPELTKNVDASPRKHLHWKRMVHYAYTNIPICVEIRTKENMWSWEWVLEQGVERVDADRIFERLGEAKEDWMGL